MIDVWWLVAGDSQNVWEKLWTQKTSGVQKGIPHLHPKTIPDFHEKIGIARKQSEISENLGLPENSQRLATPRSKPLGLAQPHWRKMKDAIQRSDWSKDRYSRRTKRIHNPMQCIYMFCIVLQSYVYLYTQFQNPPYLVECWISLKFTDKTTKNFHLQLRF